MRAIGQLPELKEKIESGKLSLSVIALAESALRRNAKREKRKVDIAEQREVLEQVGGLSRRKAEEVLAEKFELELSKPQTERAPPNGVVRMTLEFSEDEIKEIEELRRLSSRPPTAKEMILSLVRAEAGKKKRQLGEEPHLRKSKFTQADLASAGGSEMSLESENFAKDESSGLKAKNLTKAIPIGVKRDVWVRA